MMKLGEGEVHGSGDEVGVSLFEELLDALEEDGEVVVIVAPLVEVVNSHFGGELLGSDQTDC